MQPLQHPDPSTWIIPDFYSADRDDYFEAAVRSAAVSQGLQVEEPVVEKPKRSRKIVPSDAVVPAADPLAGIRRHLYGCALYAPGFGMSVTFKNQPFRAGFIPGHQWGDCVAGPQKSSVMVIGKMPGKDEISKSRNFVGPSGQLLSEQLRALSVDPASWYVTNLVKFAPPANFSGALPKPWIHVCKALLLMELAIVQPEYILCLGSEASKELLDITVDRAYGSSFDYSYLTDPGDPTSAKTARTVVALHPAAVVRKADRINQFQLSLRQFRDLTGGAAPTIKESGLHHFVIENEHQMKGLIDSVLSGPLPMVSVDAEWFGRRPEENGAFLRCFQFSWKEKHAAVVSLTDAKGNYKFDGDPFKQFARLFTCDNPPRLVGHNIKADLMWLKAPMAKQGIDIVRLAMPPETGDKGPSETRVRGGFDTMLAMHSVKETGPFELESLGVLYLGVPRYDSEVHALLKNKVPHGYMPDEVLYPYAAYDADVTLRLAYLFNGGWKGPNTEDCVRPGYLDQDPEFGLDSRKSFWNKMMAMPAFMEMEETGIVFDTNGCIAMRKDFLAAREILLANLRNEIQWPDFNPNSINHKKELLFGESLNGKKTVAGGPPVRIRPEGAISLNLTPLKSTGKQSMPWSRVVSEGLVASYSPSTAKDTLGVFAHKNKTVKKIMDLSFLSQALNTALREPVAKSMIGLPDADAPEAAVEAALDMALPDASGAEDEDQPEMIAQRGLMDYVCGDGAIRSIYFQTKETGRASSAKPNLMAVSKRRDKDYKRILKDTVGDIFRPIRSLFKARPGKLLVEADFIGAELAVMAWLSGDLIMMDHVRRSGLPESDPNHFDIHSSFAVEIFRLGLPPIKSALEAAGKKAFRDAVKTLVFGIPYGRGLEAVIMAVKEESGIELTIEEATKIRDSIFARYPKLAAFLERKKDRVLRPGFLREPHGGLRRFSLIDDKKAIEDAKREAGNFGIQATVASTMSLGLYYLRAYREHIEPAMDYRIVNQIHDAAISECAAKDVDHFVKKVIPLCLSEAVQFRPLDDDGRPVSDTICKFDLDIHVYERWGQDLTHDDCDRLEIPRIYGKPPKAKAA